MSLIALRVISQVAFALCLFPSAFPGALQNTVHLLSSWWSFLFLVMVNDGLTVYY